MHDKMKRLAVARAGLYKVHSDGSVHAGKGGFFKKILPRPIQKFFHKPLGNREHGIRPVLRKIEQVARKEVLPVAAAVAGYHFGGPLGATAASAAAGALRSSHNVGKNMVKGGMKGLAISGGMELAQKFAGMQLGATSGAAAKKAAEKGFFEKLASGQNPFSSAGSSAASGLGKILGGGRGKGLGNLLGGQEEGESKGLMGSLGIDPFDALLMGGALAGNLGAKTEKDKKEMEEFNKLQHVKNPADELPQPHAYQWNPQYNPNYARNINPYETYYGEVPFLNPRPPQLHYAEGGYVHGGSIPGDSGGQDDDFDAYIPEGSFVMDATTVSALGDGNTKNGEKKIKQIRDRFLDSGIIPYDLWNRPIKPIKVKLSPGETVIEPEVVRALGKGSERKGIKKIENIRVSVRKDKGMKKFHPPKSKSIEHYLK